MTCLQQQDAKDIKESDEVSDGQGHLKKIISHSDTDPSVLAKVSNGVNAPSKVLRARGKAELVWRE